MKKPTVFFEEKLEWEVVDEKLKRQIVGFDENIMMVNVHFKKGGIGAITQS